MEAKLNQEEKGREFPHLFRCLLDSLFMNKGYYAGSGNVPKHISDADMGCDYITAHKVLLRMCCELALITPGTGEIFYTADTNKWKVEGVVTSAFQAQIIAGAFRSINVPECGLKLRCRSEGEDYKHWRVVVNVEMVPVNKT